VLIEEVRVEVAAMLRLNKSEMAKENYIAP
jgi:hypothetical protein